MVREPPFHSRNLVNGKANIFESWACCWENVCGGREDSLHEALHSLLVTVLLQSTRPASTTRQYAASPLFFSYPRRGPLAFRIGNYIRNGKKREEMKEGVLED